MAKTERSTDKLNVALSGVTASVSILKTLAEELPPSDTKRQIGMTLAKMSSCATEAFEHLRAIRKSAESI